MRLTASGGVVRRMAFSNAVYSDQGAMAAPTSAYPRVQRGSKVRSTAATVFDSPRTISTIATARRAPDPGRVAASTEQNASGSTATRKRDGGQGHRTIPAT